MNARDEEGNAVLMQRSTQALVIFALIAVFFLLTEHRAHVLAVLPWLLLAACPLMHLFMHHGQHGGHRREAQDNRERMAGGHIHDV